MSAAAQPRQSDSFARRTSKKDRLGNRTPRSGRRLPPPIPIMGANNFSEETKRGRERCLSRATGGLAKGNVTADKPTSQQQI